MKGCLVVLAIGVVLIALLGAGTCVVGQPLVESAQDYDAGISKVESSTDEMFPFTPTPETSLTAERFGQALRVREAMNKALDSEAGALLDFVHGHLELHEGLKQLRGAYGTGRKALVEVPLLLERELTAARMSLRELAWIVETAYGHVFAAADRGDARAKAIDEQLLAIAGDRSLGADASLDILDRFRNRCEASIDALDPRALEIILAAGERFPGAPSAIGSRPGPLGFDLFLCERVRRTRASAEQLDR